MKTTFLLLAMVAILNPTIGFTQGCEEEDVPTLPSLRCENALESLKFFTDYDGTITVTYTSKSSGIFSSVASNLLNVEFSDAMKGQLVITIPAANTKACVQKVSGSGLSLISCVVGVNSSKTEIIDGSSVYSWTKGPAVSLDIKTVTEESARNPLNQVKFSFSFYKYGKFETSFDKADCR